VIPDILSLLKVYDAVAIRLIKGQKHKKSGEYSICQM
jgi:hypothetical protein